MEAAAWNTVSILYRNCRFVWLHVRHLLRWWHADVMLYLIKWLWVSANVVWFCFQRWRPKNAVLHRLLTMVRDAWQMSLRPVLLMRSTSRHARGPHTALLPLFYGLWKTCISVERVFSLCGLLTAEREIVEWASHWKWGLSRRLRQKDNMLNVAEYSISCTALHTIVNADDDCSDWETRQLVT